MKPTRAAARVAIAVAALALVLAACGDESQPAPDPSPTVLAAAAPTATFAPTVAPTPSPTSTMAPMPASNIPIPTPAPISTPTPPPTFTPSPTPEPAAALMQSARAALEESETWAFDLNVVSNDGAREITIALAGDYIDGAYLYAEGSAESEGEAVDLRLSRFEDTRYVMNAANREWQRIENPPPFDFFTDASALLRGSGLQILGQETVGGVKTDVVAGKVKPYGGGELDAVYLFDADDGSLREVRIEGEMEAATLETLLGDWGAQPASMKATARFSDFGKPVLVAAPTMIFAPFDHVSFLLADGRVMLSGGVTGIANNNVIANFPIPFPQFYDFSKSTWSLGQPIDGETVEGLVFPDGMYSSAVRMQGGGVIAVGIAPDDSGQNIVGHVSALDADAESWEALPGLVTARVSPALALLSDGRLLTVGGLDASDLESSAMPVDAVEIFDPKSGAWSEAAQMNGGAAANMALIALEDGRALALTGQDSENTTAAQVYDPKADAWSEVRQPESPRAQPVALLLADGRVLVTGAGVAEIYDPASDTWTRTEAMSEYRDLHSLTLLPDDRVLAAGGSDQRSSDYLIHSTTEIFDPRSNSWSRGPDMSERRMSHSATLLANGSVFIAGGIGIAPRNGEIYPLPNAEVVEP